MAKKAVKKKRMHKHPEPIKKVSTAQPRHKVLPEKKEAPVHAHPAQKEKKPCKACSVSEPMHCPLCSGEGLVLIAVAVILIALGYTWSRYLAWAALLLAFLVPMIKRGFNR